MSYGPLDTLMIFTTTISVSSIYSTSIVVMIPIIWLYITVVVVVISFSIMVLCILISLLLVTVGIIQGAAEWTPTFLKVTGKGVVGAGWRGRW